MAAVKGFSVRFRGKHLFFINIPQILLYVFLGLFVCFTALPLIYVISTAFKPMDELFLYPPRFFVRNPTMSNFGDLFAALDNTSVPFSRAIFNSLFTSAVTVVLTVIVSAMAAYGMVKHHPRGSNLIFNLILVADVFPACHPDPKLHDRQKSGAYQYLLGADPAEDRGGVQYVPGQTVPRTDAGRLSGGGAPGRCERVAAVLENCHAVCTPGVFSFVGNWNDYFSPLVFTNSDAMKTLPLAIQSIAGGPGAASLATAGSMAASTFVMTLPTVLIYTFMQSKVLSTMSYSGIKA